MFGVLFSGNRITTNKEPTMGHLDCILCELYKVHQTVCLLDENINYSMNAMANTDKAGDDDVFIISVLKTPWEICLKKLHSLTCFQF